MSDRTLPRSLRMMEGFGIHSFCLINAKNESTFVKFHWRPKLGLQSTLWDEAVKISGVDADFHRRDLFEAISNGQFPEWELAVQLFTQAQADTFPFDHLDATKLIPEEIIPLRVIGRMVLNRWPNNFFADTEQVAFCPSHILPGMDFSNDPLLQGRLFSYQDTQLSRLGSSNFTQIPINTPKCPFSNQQRDGHMQMTQPVGRVNYEPNTLALDAARERSTIGFHSQKSNNSGEKIRIRAESFSDHYSQARQFYRSQSNYEQLHIASAFVFELSKVEHPHIRVNIIAHLRNIDETLARKVGHALGVTHLPDNARNPVAIQDLPISPALQIIGNMKATLAGRTIGVVVMRGSNREQIDALRQAILGAGAWIKFISPTIGTIELSDGSLQLIDWQLTGTSSVIVDAIALILTETSASALCKEAAHLDFVRDAFCHLKAICVNEGGVIMLKKAGIDIDSGIVNVAAADEFIAAAATRQWNRENKIRMLA